MQISFLVCSRILTELFPWELKWICKIPLLLILGYILENKICKFECMKLMFYPGSVVVLVGGLV